MKQPYKIQNRTSESHRVKFVKNGGTVSFPKTPTASFVENSREAGFCLTAITPLPLRDSATDKITLTSHPMGTDGRVSLYINGTLIESKRFLNKARIADRQAWFNSEFGAYVTYSGKELATFKTAIVSPDVYRFVFEDDDLDYIFADTTNAAGDLNPTLIVEQYRLAFDIVNNKVEISPDEATIEYGDYILRYEMVDGNGTIPHNRGGQAGNVSVRFTGQSSGEFNPAGLHFNFMGTDYTIYSETDAIIVPIERIVPNTFFSRRYFVVRNDITLISPDVLLIGSNYDYDLAQPTNYWDAYARYDGNYITVTVNGTTTQFDGNLSVLWHLNMQNPTIRAGDSIIVQAKTFYGGSHLCFGTNAKWNMGTLDSTGKLEFTIPLNQNNFTTFSFYDPNMIDEREFPNDYGFAELRYFNFSL